MAPYGGFDHNAQALRIVTRLERHYADFDGLNLTWETLEGIAKHNGPVEPRRCPMRWPRSTPNGILSFTPIASAEAQVAAIADDVAYSHHDLHDGLRSGLFTEDDLMELPVTGPAFAEVDATYPGLDPMRRRHEALRRVFGRMVEDVIAVAKNRLDAAQPRSVEEIRAMGATVIRFSKPLYQELKAIRSFLFHRMYRAPSVMEERAEGHAGGQRPVPAVHGAARPAARRMAGRHRRRRGRDGTRPHRRRLRRGHDRPLRLAGASAPLRLRPDPVRIDATQALWQRLWQQTGPEDEPLRRYPRARGGRADRR